MGDAKSTADPTHLTTSGDIPPRFRYEDWNGPDVAKSFGSGLISGFSGLFGLPGDAQQMINGLHEKYVRPIEQRLGFQGPPPELLQQIYSQQPNLLPTSKTISKLAAALLGQPHQPETDYGNVAYTAGEKLPAVPLFALTRGF